jgi:hypothetical protein
LKNTLQIFINYKQLKMKNLVVLLLLAAFTYSCETNNCHCPIDATIAVGNDSILRNAMNNAYFKGQWAKFDEPVLFQQNKEMYRFYFKSSVRDLFKLYRIEKNANDYTLYIKEFAVVDGDKATLKKNFSRKLDEAEWLAITDKMGNKCFWTMPVKMEENRAFDATTYIVEGFKPENNGCTEAKYHLVPRSKLENVPSFGDIIDAFEGLESKASH